MNICRACIICRFNSPAVYNGIWPSKCTKFVCWFYYFIVVVISVHLSKCGQLISATFTGNAYRSKYFNQRRYFAFYFYFIGHILLINIDNINKKEFSVYIPRFVLYQSYPYQEPCFLDSFLVFHYLNLLMPHKALD